jgi:hypothetical protein
MAKFGNETILANPKYSQPNMIEIKHFHLDLVQNLCYYETCIGLALSGKNRGFRVLLADHHE